MVAYWVSVCGAACVCRKQHGDYFGIGVAGYPEAHPDFIVEDVEQMKKNYWDGLAYLKQKVGMAYISFQVHIPHMI